MAGSSNVAEDNVTVTVEQVGARGPKGLKGDKGDQGNPGPTGLGADDPGDLVIIFENRLI